MSRPKLAKDVKKSNILNIRLTNEQLAELDACVEMVRANLEIDTSRSQIAVSLMQLGLPEFKKRHSAGKKSK